MNGQLAHRSSHDLLTDILTYLSHLSYLLSISRSLGL